MKKLYFILAISIVLNSSVVWAKSSMNCASPLNQSKTQAPVAFQFFSVKIFLEIPNFNDIAFNRELTDPNFESMLSSIASRLESVHKTLQRTADSLQLPPWWRFQLYLQAAKSIEKSDDRIPIVLLALLERTPFAVTLVQESTKQKKVRSIALAINEKLFFASNLEYLNCPFYLIDAKTGRFHTLSSTQVELLPIPQEKMNRKRPLDLALKDMPDFGGSLISKEWVWNSGGKVYSLKGQISQTKMACYAAYPQRDLPTYFEGMFGQPLYSLADSLHSLIQKEKKVGIEAVQFLHDFVTYALPYKEDKATERGEHCSFAEESLFDDFTDCEDRTILLALLYKRILGIRPLILEYKDHVSLAIPISKEEIKKLPPSKPGRNGVTVLKFESKDYLPVDPSFFNSSVGEVNPLFSKRQTERIFLIP